MYAPHLSYQKEKVVFFYFENTVPLTEHKFECKDHDSLC